MTVSISRTLTVFSLFMARQLLAHYYEQNVLSIYWRCAAVAEDIHVGKGYAHLSYDHRGIPLSDSVHQGDFRFAHHTAP